MKSLRKPYISIFLASLILFVSCTKNQDNIDNIMEQQSFDYSVYHDNRNTNIDFISGFSNQSIESNNRDSFIEVLDLINDEFETGEFLNNLDEKYFTLNQAQSTPYQVRSNKNVDINSHLNETDINLIEDFNKDIKSLSFSEALTNFEKNVLQLNLNDNEFRKYNKLANVFLIIENSFPGMLANDTENFENSFPGMLANDAESFENSFRIMLKDEEKDEDCGWAITSYTLATVGLSACASVVLCPFAIAAKIIAFRNMVSACKEKEDVGEKE